MGPSGSGKTTLLSILGLRVDRAMRVRGAVRYNGAPASKAVKRRLGFVSQDDLLLPGLTVHETLLFTALLRTPRSVPHREKLAKVEQLLGLLELEGVRGTVIGNALMRGVSGGERKRVAVGRELLLEPAVLLLDEPTSGLDATTARDLLRLLKGLAGSGRTICTSLHQPSSRLFELLDQLLLLAQGHALYWGRADGAAGWLEGLGLTCPFGVNLADCLMDVASGDFGGCRGTFNGDLESLIAHGDQTQLARFPLVPAAQPEAPQAGADAAHASPDVDGHSIPSEKVTSSFRLEPNVVQEEGGSWAAAGCTCCTQFCCSPKWGASYWEQVRVLTVRSVRSRRFHSLSKNRFTQVAVAGLLMGALFWQVGDTQTLSAAQNVLGALFMSIIHLTHNSLFDSVLTLPADRAVLVAERRSGMYRLSAYLLSRCVADLPLGWAFPFLFATCLYWAAGLRVAAWAYAANIASLLLLVTGGQQVGLAIGALVMDAGQAVTVAILYIIAAFLSGGYFVRAFPPWLAWLRFLSPCYYTFNLLLAVEMRGREYRVCGSEEEVGQDGQGGGCTVVSDLQDGLNLPFDPLAPWWPDLLGMLCMLGVVTVLAYLGLRYNTRR